MRSLASGMDSWAGLGQLGDPATNLLNDVYCFEL